MPTRKDRIASKEKKLKETQADLKKVTELNAPKGAKDEAKGLRKALKSIIAKVRATLDNLRHPKPKPDNVRASIIAFCKWGVANEPSIHYAQVRPMPLELAKAHHLPLTTDCSGFATCAYYQAGAPDPNGYGYNGQGYTGTLLSHCQHISPSDAKPGDLVVFGYSPGTHVVVLVEDGSKGLAAECVSHGQEAGPIQVPLSVEASAHSGQPLTYLRGL